MRREGTSRGTDRESVTWSGPEGNGTRRKSFTVVLVTAFALLTSVLAGSTTAAAANSDVTAVVPSSLIEQATANPNQIFHVIVQGTKGNSSQTIAQDVTTQSGKLKRKFLSISGVAADVSGKDLLKLARHPHVRAITPDAVVQTAGYENAEMWRYSADVTPLWGTPAVSCATNPLTHLQLDASCVPSAAVPAPQAPAVAIVDSGIDASRIGDFGSRVVASVNLSSLSPGTNADLEGHGTMVAGILAGTSPLYPGVADNAPIVSLRTADANGESVVSDVIAAADWILANKDT